MEIALDPTRKQHTIYSVKFKKCIIFPSELISNYCFCKITTKTYNTLSKKFQKDLDKSIVFLKFMINSSPYLRQYINIVELNSIKISERINITRTDAKKYHNSYLGVMLFTGKKPKFDNPNFSKQYSWT